MKLRDLRSLGELLRLDIDDVEISANGEYNIAGVYGFGRGLFARGPITGSGTSYKKLHRLHAGQLVLSRLKAFEGAVAVVPDEFDGWHLSPEFPTFRCADGELDERYLSHICRWPDFWTMLAATSKGIGSRRERVHPNDLLGLKLRVHPIDEQPAVAERLDGVQEAVSALDGLGKRSIALTSALVVSASTRPDLDSETKLKRGWQLVPLAKVMKPSMIQVKVDPLQQYSIAGIYSFGRGLINRGVISGAATSYDSLTVLSEGDVVISKLGGWEGAVTVVGKAFQNFFVSAEFPTFTIDRSELLPAFFSGVTKAPAFWRQIDNSTRGSMARRKRITPSEFLTAQFWLPPMDLQHQIAHWLQSLDGVATIREATRSRIDALVGSALNQAFASVR